MTQYIESNKGNLYIIDDIDRDLLNYHWSENNYGYIQSKIKGKVEFLHLIIAGRMAILEEGFICDHRDRDVTNNCRDNLRIATHSQNQQNCKKHNYHGNPYSKYKGVTYHKVQKVWFSTLTKDKIKFQLGTFKTEEDAARAYNVQAKYYFGEFAVLNDVPDA